MLQFIANCKSICFYLNAFLIINAKMQKCIIMHNNAKQNQELIK